MPNRMMYHLDGDKIEEMHGQLIHTSDKDTNDHKLSNDQRLSRELENSQIISMSKADLLKSNSTNTSKS